MRQKIGDPGPIKLCTILPHTSVLPKLSQLQYGAKHYSFSWNLAFSRFTNMCLVKSLMDPGPHGPKKGIKREAVLANYTSVTLTIFFSWHWLSSLVWDPSLENFRLGSFAWELSLGIFSLRMFAWDSSPCNFRLGFFRLGALAWEVSLRNIRQGIVAEQRSHGLDC